VIFVLEFVSYLPEAQKNLTFTILNGWLISKTF